MKRTYTIPMRGVRRAPRTKRAAKAMKFLKAFISKHTKNENIKIDNELNEKMWSSGIEKIPARIKVEVASQEDGSILVKLA